MLYLSIIIPVYNVEEYVSKCIDSVLEQDFYNYELILVDDGSTDKSGYICDLYKNNDKKIKVIHKQNGGLSSARNAGIKISKGEFILYIDSDDFLAPNALKIYHDIQKTTDADIIIGNYYYLYDNRIVVANTIFNSKTLLSGSDAIKLLINQKIQNFAWGKLIKGDLARAYIFPEGRYYEDTFWFHNIIDKGMVCIIPNPLIYYRQRIGSISYSNKIKLMDRILGLEERYKYLQRYYPYLLNIFKEHFATDIVNISRNFFFLNRTKRYQIINEVRNIIDDCDLINISNENIKNRICLLKKNIFFFIINEYIYKIKNKIYSYVK